MRLFEAIIEANKKMSGVDKPAPLEAEQFIDSLPIVALTCIDPRLNRILPNALGVPADCFVWLRNAGNIITGPFSSTTRSIAIACAIKEGKEIAVIGHTDCLVGKTTVLELIDRFNKLGVPRVKLPENVLEFFGLFASERQNVIKAVEFIRASPLISPKIPVHGLLVDTATGRLEMVVNGYRVLESAASSLASSLEIATAKVEAAKAAFDDMKVGETKISETKIGEVVTKVVEVIEEIKETAQKHPEAQTPGELVLKTASDLAKNILRDKFYRVIGSDQKVYGPVSGTKMIQWLEEGRIDADTLVQLEGGSEWSPLGKLAEQMKKFQIPPTITEIKERIRDKGRHKH